MAITITSFHNVIIVISFVIIGLTITNGLKCYMCGQYNEGVGSITPCLNYSDRYAHLYLKECTKSSEKYCVVSKVKFRERHLRYFMNNCQKFYEIRRWTRGQSAVKLALSLYNSKIAVLNRGCERHAVRLKALVNYSAHHVVDNILVDLARAFLRRKKAIKAIVN